MDDNAVVSAATDSATIIVELPADARLLVDGQATVSTSSVRVLSSPSLQAGKDFQYTLKADVTRNGKTVSTTRTVKVRAGEETRVTLQLPEAVASAQ
jgi:uncharacterized protein (TIGR03000 family)